MLSHFNTEISQSSRGSGKIKVSSGKHEVCPQNQHYFMVLLNTTPCKAHLIPSDVPWPLAHM